MMWAGSSPRPPKSNVIMASSRVIMHVSRWAGVGVGVVRVPAAHQPPAGRRGCGGSLVGFAVGHLAALVEGAAGAHQDGQLVVKVVAVPGGDPGAGPQAECLPRVPQGREAADGLVVLPPLGAPPELAAERAAEHRQEVVDPPVFERGVVGLGHHRAQRAQTVSRAVSGGPVGGKGRGESLVSGHQSSWKVAAWKVRDAGSAWIAPSRIWSCAARKAWVISGAPELAYQGMRWISAGLMPVASSSPVPGGRRFFGVSP